MTGAVVLQLALGWMTERPRSVRDLASQEARKGASLDIRGTVQVGRLNGALLYRMRLAQIGLEVQRLRADATHAKYVFNRDLARELDEELSDLLSALSEAHTVPDERRQRFLGAHVQALQNDEGVVWGELWDDTE